MVTIILYMSDNKLYGLDSAVINELWQSVAIESGQFILK
jgi:hypothetical protein